MEVSTKSQKNIGVFAFPFTTHAAPLLCLIRRLSAAAPHLNFTFFSTQQSNDSLFPKNNEGLYYDNYNNKIKPCSVETGLPEDYVYKGNPHEPVNYFINATPGNFKRAVMDMEKKISCLITDAFLWFGADMAAKMGVPWIPVWTAGPRGLLVNVDVDDIREHLGFNEPQDKTLDFIPGFSDIRLEDIPDGITSGSVDEPIHILLYNMAKRLPPNIVVAVNSFDELDPTVINTLKTRIHKFLNIGPLTLACPPSLDTDSDPLGCIQWLDKQEKSSVAYVSFGSVITPPSDELEALAEALEESGVPFLWSFRGNPEDRFAKGFLERTRSQGKIVPWVSQLKVLSHSSVGVFLTHCGWNSIIESIIGGVPMICRPFFGDQGLNRRTIEAVWGIGQGVEGGKFSKEGTMKAMEAILTSDEGELMRERINVLKEEAFEAVKSDGSSTVNFKALLDTIT